MHYPGGNATDPIWRVLASSLEISSWTPLKPQHSNPNPSPLANQLWCIDFLTPHTLLIIPHRLPAFLESLIPLKNWCSIHAADWWNYPLLLLLMVYQPYFWSFSPVSIVVLGIFISKSKEEKRLQINFSRYLVILRLMLLRKICI